MDASREKHVRYTKPSGEVDRLSNLPDCLIHHVLLNLPIKDVVKISLLSSRWKNLWRHVPGLDLETDDFPEHDSFVSFVNNFLEFNVNNGSCLQSFKLAYDSSEAVDPENGFLIHWLDTVAKLKVKHLDVTDNSANSWEHEMSPTIYTYGSLVSLKLCGLTLPSPPEHVYLTSLRDMDLMMVEFTDEWDLEKFISRCPCLKNLSIERSYTDDTPILRVHSQSLLSFIHIANSSMEFDDERTIEIDAPMLEYLNISDGRTSSFKLKNMNSLVQADIDTVFSLTPEKRLNPNDQSKMTMIHNFIIGISRVIDMTIASCTLMVIYAYSRHVVRTPIFCNLSSLCVMLHNDMWEMLPVFLETCPNLKSLVLGYASNYNVVLFTIYSRPLRQLPSLEYVTIEKPLKGEALEIKLVSYFLENSPILKKLTLSLDDSLKKEESAIFKDLFMIRRRSKFCEVVMVSNNPYRHIAITNEHTSLSLST